jgi:hypothetical protein
VGGRAGVGFALGKLQATRLIEINLGDGVTVNGRIALMLIADVKARTRDAAAALRSGTLPATPAAKKCGACDYRGMCTSGRAVGTGR